MKCSECQFDNREGAKFCKECGAKLELTCPECGSIYAFDSKFCDECGHDISKPIEAFLLDYSKPKSYTPTFIANKVLTSRSSIEGERKLVTVLFADVANYTAMAEKLDPEEIHKIMDGCFKILMYEIHKYEGTINQFTGDGVMALFGAPIAHEDHAQRACYASLAIQQSIEEYGENLEKKFGFDFKMRVGLNSGVVVVGSIGDDLRMDYTAVGDTTNLAARMESKAEPGYIFVSENTHRLSKDFFEFYPLGKIEVKGKEKPQDAYRLVRTGEIETRIGASMAKGLTRFVGRKKSISALKEAYNRALSGSGQAVGIVGEAGEGKSRLLLEFINQLPLDEYTCLAGHCQHYGSGMAYLPIIDLVKSYFEVEEGDHENIVTKKLSEKVQQLDERLAGTLPSFQEFLSIKVDDEKYLQIDPGQKKLMFYEAIRDLFIRVSEKKPLVIVIEDLHWIDKTSEDCINYLIDWLANTRILLILLYRLEYTHKWGSKSFYTKIGLTQLGTTSSTELVQAILENGAVVPILRDLILNRSGGNPLYMEEFTHNLLENGLIDWKDDQYVLTRNVAEIQVPDTIQGIIAARIDRIEENLKRVMQIASVIGKEFAFRILQTILDRRKDLKTALLDLQGLEFISKKKLFPELEYIFKHALTQEVAYNSLLKERRKEIHEKIGNSIEALHPDNLEEYYELLAYHFGHSDNKEKTIEYLDLSNQKAINANAVQEAKKYFDDAMEILDDLPDSESNQRRRVSLLLKIIPVMLLLFKYPEYHELLTRYESSAIGLGDQGLLGAFYGRLGTCEWGFGNFDKAIQLDAKAAELCQAAGNIDEAAYAYCQLQWSHLYRGNFDEVIHYKDRALQAMEYRPNLRNYSWALQAASWAHSYLGHWDAAVEEGQEELKLAEQFSDNSAVSFAAWIISIAYNFKGDLDRAIEYGELSVQKAPSPADQAWGGACLAWALCKAGQAQKYVENLASLITIYRAGNFVPGEAHTLFLAEGYFLAEAYDKATQTLEELLEIAERCGMRFIIGSSHRFLGEIAMVTNPTQKEEPIAATYFEKSIAVLREIKAENELALAYAGYGRLQKRKGQIAHAREFLKKALQIFERLGTLIEPDRVREELKGLVEA
jgi:class 3 adenylate cyclase/tetratricopeptide (TPR) repeat protein